VAAASGIPAVDVIRRDRIVRVGGRDVRATRVAPATTCVATGKVRVPTAAREAGVPTTGKASVATATTHVRTTATAASDVSATTTPTVGLTGAGRHRSPQRDRGSGH
jgi:hypothetical protein